MTADAPARRIAYLDGLRALAVLLVVVHHAARHYAPTAPVPYMSLRHLLLEGAHGVDLFFVLSGFCLSHPLLARLRSSGTAVFDVSRYLAKRILRILPPYYGAILFFAVSGLSMQPFGVLDIVKQVFLFDWQTAFVNESFWTLCVEFRWYFLFPLALLLWTRAPRAFLSVACAAALLYAFTLFHWVADSATIVPFMLGIVAASIEINALRIARFAPAGLGIALGVGLLLEIYGPSFPAFFVQTNPGWHVAAFWFVVLCARPAWRRVLGWKPLVWTGVASYSIYLVHEPIIAAIESQGVPSVGRAVAAGIVSVAAGFVFWAVWERFWIAGNLKDAALPAVERACAFAAARIQVPARFTLTSENVPGETAPVALARAG